MADIHLDSDVLGEIANQVVQLTAEHYGKGPVEAKAYQCDNFVVCAMKGGLTAAEKTFLSNGHDEELVRTLRTKFQSVMADEFRRTVERITGREVLSYHSQIVFDPDYVFEIFVLGDEKEPSRPGE